MTDLLAGQVHYSRVEAGMNGRVVEFSHSGGVTESAQHKCSLFQVDNIPCSPQKFYNRISIEWSQFGHLDRLQYYSGFKNDFIHMANQWREYIKLDRELV